jgi:hypothetical protein
MSEREWGEVGEVLRFFGGRLAALGSGIFGAETLLGEAAPFGAGVRAAMNGEVPVVRILVG